MLKWLLLLLALALLAAAIGRAVTDRRARQIAAPSASAPATLELAPQDLVTVKPVELTRSLQVSGTLKAVRTAVVKAKVAGEVKALDVQEGDRVSAGQVLGRLDATEYAARLKQAQQQAASARAQLEIAESTLNNNRALVAQGFISRNALDTSVSNTAGARANLLAAQAATDIARKAVDDAVLRAPIAGQVSQRLAQPGERVSVDARLLEIVDLSRIELEAAVAPQEVGAVTIGAAARLEVDGLDESVEARVARINPSTQPGTRSVTVYLAVAPQPALRQGLFATGRIALGTERVLAVPESAVRTDRARPYVLAVVDGKVLRQDVETGVRGHARAGDESAGGESAGGESAGGETMVALEGGVSAGTLVLAARAGSVAEGTAVALPAPQPSSAAR